MGHDQMAVSCKLVMQLPQAANRGVPLLKMCTLSVWIHVDGGDIDESNLGLLRMITVLLFVVEVYC